MSNNLKPWFREDLIQAMMSVYFSSLISRPRKQSSDEYRTGFAAALSSVALAIGISPDAILESSDLELLRNSVNKK